MQRKRIKSRTWIKKTTTRILPRLRFLAKSVDRIVAAVVLGAVVPALASLPDNFTFKDFHNVIRVITSPIVLTIFFSTLSSGVAVIVFFQWQKRSSLAKQGILTLKVALGRAYRELVAQSDLNPKVLSTKD